eukprot:TRINITY_DN10097_c0_g1_i1.p2 TRINITY_DN10097_c0_g1~~TRINITY_DN10097_c0_g1_i1.p2  ORF type:complete len:292 (+),score=38.68 TRINITY_DN10097_c0_g1_i1:805-1680(+)
MESSGTNTQSEPLLHHLITTIERSLPNYAAHLLPAIGILVTLRASLSAALIRDHLPFLNRVFRFAPCEVLAKTLETVLTPKAIALSNPTAFPILSMCVEAMCHRMMSEDRDDQKAAGELRLRLAREYPPQSLQALCAEAADALARAQDDRLGVFLGLIRELAHWSKSDTRVAATRWPQLSEYLADCSVDDTYLEMLTQAVGSADYVAAQAAVNSIRRDLLYGVLATAVEECLRRFVASTNEYHGVWALGTAVRLGVNFLDEYQLKAVLAAAAAVPDLQIAADRYRTEFFKE